MEDKQSQETSGLLEIYYVEELPKRESVPGWIVLYAVAAVLLVIAQLIGKLQ